MATITIHETGWIDRQDSAFPQVAAFPDGELVCSFCVDGGPNVHGGSALARSLDQGRSWQPVGTILPPTQEPFTTNHLKVTLAPHGETLLAYGARMYRTIGEKFGEGHNEAIVLRSTDRGRTWSAPLVLPNPDDCPLEVSHGIRALASGRLIAPSAVLPAADRLGERVLLSISDDAGHSWPRQVVAFQDPAGLHGYFEHKFVEVTPGRILGVCWTVTLKDVADQPDHFVWSTDNGETWSTPRSTGVMGQTMTPLPLGGDRFLVVYNRRKIDPAVVMQLATITADTWTVEREDILYNGRRMPVDGQDAQTDGVADFDTFGFGFPTTLPLADGHILATWWCNEDNRHGIRFARLSIT